MRSWNVSAYFPEVKPAHLAQQSCKVDAPDFESATELALVKMRESEGLKGKHISTARLTIVAIGKEKRQCQHPE